MGVLVAIVAICGMEAGAPIPVPADLVLLGLGERAGSHTVPLWVVIVGLEVAALVGTTVLFLLARRIGERLLDRLEARGRAIGPRVTKVRGLLEGRGGTGIAVGRATPGLRTLTVLVAASSRLGAREALVPLVVGSTLFVQAHVILGYAVGPSVRDALGAAPVIGIAVLAILGVVGLVAWLLRRGRADGVRGWTEGACPACLALGIAGSRGAAVAGRGGDG
jgi:membrane protein DedA with SNARE-associated domain